MEGNPKYYEHINPGKKSYKDYLYDAYGGMKARYLISKKSQEIIEGIKRAEIKKDLQRDNSFLFERKEAPEGTSMLPPLEDKEIS